MIKFNSFRIKSGLSLNSLPPWLAHYLSSTHSPCPEVCRAAPASTAWRVTSGSVLVVMSAATATEAAAAGSDSGGGGDDGDGGDGCSGTWVESSWAPNGSGASSSGMTGTGGTASRCSLPRWLGAVAGRGRNRFVLASAVGWRFGFCGVGTRVLQT